jgi:hypothetical protein
MAKDRDDRYPTAGALAGDLRAAIAGGGAETVAVPVERPTRVDATGVLPHKKRRWVWVVAVIVLLAAAAAVAAIWATRDSSSGDRATDLRPFVDRIENVLSQSAAGRREIAAAISAGRACKITNAQAAQRIGSVADNRQSVLQQLASFSGPTPATDRMVPLLQQALQNSIEADRHYRDWFSTSTQCPLPANQSFELAQASDQRATAAKERFVAQFQPLASTLHERVWTAGQF